MARRDACPRESISRRLLSDLCGCFILRSASISAVRRGRFGLLQVLAAIDTFLMLTLFCSFVVFLGPSGFRWPVGTRAPAS